MNDVVSLNAQAFIKCLRCGRERNPSAMERKEFNGRMAKMRCRLCKDWTMHGLGYRENIETSNR